MPSASGAVQSPWPAPGLTQRRQLAAVEARGWLTTAYAGVMSDVAQNRDGTPRGTALLPRDLTADELASAPVLTSLDGLLIDGLTDDEDDAFAAALDT